MANTTVNGAPAPHSVSLRIFKSLLRGTVQQALIGILLFVSAGTIKVPLFWAYLILAQLVFIIGVLPTLAKDPALAKEREKVSWRKGTQSLANRFRVVPLLIFLFAGVDVGRIHWIKPVPWPGVLVGLILMAAGTVILMWSVSSNTFFSNTIRIQSDRNHRVVSSGPYRFMRHPGYLGMILSYFGTCLFLGSWLSLVPGTLITLLFIHRAYKEDRFLREKLDGYLEYSADVRYRLLPAVW